jgi:hypothetical protein
MNSETLTPTRRSLQAALEQIGRQTERLESRLANMETRLAEAEAAIEKAHENDTADRQDRKPPRRPPRRPGPRPITGQTSARAGGSRRPSGNGGTW